VFAGITAFFIFLCFAFAPKTFMVLDIDDQYRVEFFKEFHDDPGVPIRAYLYEDNKKYEVAYLENYYSSEENIYGFKDFPRLGLIVVFNVSDPNYVLMIIDRINHNHTPLVGTFGGHYWNQIQKSIINLHKIDQNLDFGHVYWNWEEII
jgi:hypothetical protein